MPPSEQLPGDVGPVFEDCFDTYVGGECLGTREAFLRHPGLMTARFMREYWPILAPFLAVAALLAYRHWKKKRVKNAQTHAIEKT